MTTPFVLSSGFQVETFEIEDASHSDASTMANDAEAIDLITKLGLKGQQTLVNKKTATRLPYRVMEAHECLVYQAVCGIVTKAEDYGVDAIPLRVLQVLAHAQETKLFARLEIWHPKIAKLDDPVLVGVITESMFPDDSRYHHLTRDIYYLLARWGKTLLPLEQLEAMAVDIHRKLRLSRLMEMAAEIKTALETTQNSTELAYLIKQPNTNGIN